MCIKFSLDVKFKGIDELICKVILVFFSNMLKKKKKEKKF